MDGLIMLLLCGYKLYKQYAPTELYAVRSVCGTNSSLLRSLRHYATFFVTRGSLRWSLCCDATYCCYKECAPTELRALHSDRVTSDSLRWKCNACIYSRSQAPYVCACHNSTNIHKLRRSAPLVEKVVMTVAHQAP